MGYSQSQLEAEGYVYSLSQGFRARHSEARKAQFNIRGMESVTPPQWRKNILKRAMGMGIFYIPVLEEINEDIFRYRFYFKSELDKAKFDVIMNGLVYKKGGFSSVYSIDSDDPIEKMDFCVAEIVNFFLYHPIECKFEGIQTDERKCKLIFNSNADLSAYLHALKGENGIQSRIDNIWSAKPKERNGKLPALLQNNGPILSNSKEYGPD